MRPDLAVAILATLVLAACQPQAKLPDLDRLYDMAAALETPDRRPVITIPGTLGSRLIDRDSGRVIWGGRGLAVDPDVPANEALLALPIAKGSEPLKLLKDGVRPAGVLRVAQPRVLGLSVTTDIYRGVIDTLIAGGFDFRRTRREEIESRDENLDSFEFPYDWRRDIVEAAQDLDYFITRKTRQVAEARRIAFGDQAKPVKFDIIAHSMGALVARYYLMYGAADLPEDGSAPELTWAGAEHVERVIYIAPPNAGALDAVETLINGKVLSTFLPDFPAPLVGTYPSNYQLMPRNRHNRVSVRGEDGPVDLYDVETWDRLGWGLLSPDAEDFLARALPEEPDPALRRVQAKAYVARLLKRAQAFQNAMDVRTAPPDGTDVLMVVGGGYETPAKSEYVPATGRLVETEFAEGDGVVLRSSSLLDEREGGAFRIGLDTPLSLRSVLLLPEEHLAITQSPVFGDNVLFWLLEAPRGDWAPRIEALAKAAD